ncbi:MAG: DUF1592 domain-containing protein [Planctomycetota bacterium]
MMSSDPPIRILAVPRRAMVTAFLVVAMAQGRCAVAGEHDDRVVQTREFLENYCVDCHSAGDASGDQDFESIGLTQSSFDTVLSLQAAIDQLTLGEMPPIDAERPEDIDRQAAIRTMTGLVATLRQTLQSTDRQTVLRRLNRREYLATIGDLFEVDMTMFDPTTLFPADKTVEHLDNVGDALVTSGFLVEQYLAAADEIIEKGFGTATPVTPRTWTFEGNFEQQPELSIAHRKAFGYRYMCLYDNPLAERPEGAYGPLLDFEHGVPADGLYEIRVLAAALHRDTPYSEQTLRMELDEPFRLGIRPGDSSVGELHVMQPVQPLLAESAVPDSKPEDPPTWLTFRVPLDRGMTPRFTFENGHSESRGCYNRILKVERYRQTFPRDVRDGRGIVAHRNAVLKYGRYPQIRIHEVQVRGPLETTPSRGRPQWAVLGDAITDPVELETRLRAFAERAYRRPVASDEFQSLVDFAASRYAAGRTRMESFQDTIRLILCSPSFLYFEPVRDTQSHLSQSGLASRLSYFLTGSMPDDQLTRVALDEDLSDPVVLRRETRRLLANPASSRFLEGFLDAWLNLRTLGDMPPDRGTFPEYYNKNLQADMRTETRAMFRYLIDENRPITDFLSSDYTFLNRDLAELYDMPASVAANDEAHLFRRVPLDGSRRGGLLGHASVLTVTANGIETSPIIRGVWLLENILGTPPAMPPDDVPAIDPDVRGAKNIRDLIAKHRSSAACAECHRKIDPLGFALESYDAIGRYRTTYENNVRIDCSGTLPSGQSFDDVSGLKEILVERQVFFVRMITEKLFEYALGRRFEPADQGEVHRITDQLAQQHYRTVDLIEAIATSPLFQAR